MFFPPSYWQKQQANDFNNKQATTSMIPCWNDVAAAQGPRWTQAATLETIREQEIGALFSQRLTLFGCIAAEENILFQAKVS